MARRIGFSQTLGRGLRRWWYGVADDLGRPVRSAMAKRAHTVPMTTSVPPMALGDAKNGLKILDGRIKLGSQVLDVGANGDPWSNPAPSEVYAERLHGFEWLQDISALRLDRKIQKSMPKVFEGAPKRARYLVDRWVSEFGKWNTFSWRHDILVVRTYAWLTQWQILLDDDIGTAQHTARLAVLLRQINRIRSVHKRLDSGSVKLKASGCLVMASACFASMRGAQMDRALDQLDDEIERQILADGGHVSRSPQAALEALEVLIHTDMALDRAGLPGSVQIRRAIDRLSALAAFFRAPDGGTFAFNGSGAGNAAAITTLLSYAKIKSKAFGYAPHTKYQRLDRNGTVLMMDIGGSPPRPFDLEAHLAPLSFELGGEAGRLFVNCGWNQNQPTHWRDVVRMTAAHTALVLDDYPVGALVQDGFERRIHGPAIRHDAGAVSCSRNEVENGIWLEASHEGYRDKYGLAHRRRIYMDIHGRDIRGEDSLFVPLGATPVSRTEIPFDIRFHIHPSVKVTLAQDQNSALLIQPGRIGWQFKTDGGPLKLEKSVYLSEGARPRRTEQIVISGRAYGDGDGQTRSNRVRWSVKRMGAIEA